jgi:histidinol-phosphatase (PHP family)
MVDVAVHQKLVSLGFSSHAPLPFYRPWCMNPEKLADYLNEIKQLQSTSEIEIYAGLEVDYIPNKIGPKDFSILDYTIGSIHFVESFADGSGWEIDGSELSFREGLQKIFHNNIKEVIVRYFELTREMCEKSCPTIIGHLDKIKIQNRSHAFFSETDPWYKDEVLKTLDVIQKSGAIVEVNTRGVYLKKSDTVYPSPWIIEECCKRKIPITIESDAHHSKDLTTLFQETVDIVNDAGYKKISTLINSNWQQLPFNKNGIDYKI